MKSYVDHALDIYEGILRDSVTRWPTLGSSFGKDLSYLRRAVKARGFSFFTETLPAFGKWLDLSLDIGYTSLEGFPQGYPKVKGRPKLFGDLFLCVFDEQGVLREDADAEAVLFLRTVSYCYKKIRIQHSPSQLEETLDAFFDIEKRLPSSYPNTWDSDIPKWEGRFGHPLWGYQRQTFKDNPQRDLFRCGLVPRDDSFNWDHLRAFARRCVSEIGTPDWWSISPKHGPGAVSETGGIVKFDFPNWPQKLELMFPFDWFGSGDFNADAVRPTDRDISSRLVAVPKTPKGPRLICCEPVSHQWIQQGILGWLEDRINATVFRHSINLRSQELSKERALSASIDGGEATIDLSSASDRVSTRLVEYLFQGSEVLDGFHACRTRSMVQNLSENHPKMIVLRKFSTMGSALTFPVQSIVFTMLCVWGLRHHEQRSWTLENIEDDFRRVRVYGDDLIVPVHAYETIKLLLEECGLKVNTSKTYTGFNFRESCGCDAFKGVDVTPPRILSLYDGSPSSTATMIETSNNFHKKGFWKTAEVIMSEMPEAEKKLLLIHDGEGMGLGLYSFVGPYVDHLKSGIDWELQRVYNVALGLSSKTELRRGTGEASLRQYFSDAPEPDDYLGWTSGQTGRTRLKKGRVRVYR
jgi:hypothetical protein